MNDFEMWSMNVSAPWRDIQEEIRFKSFSTMDRERDCNKSSWESNSSSHLLSFIQREISKVKSLLFGICMAVNGSVLVSRVDLNVKSLKF